MSSYATPGAFRTALTDKLRALSERVQWTLPQLRRQFAYDRLLERLYLVDDGWVVKGAIALLARGIGVRGSLDIDLYRAKAADAAEADLREAARRDLGDWFRFEVGPRRSVGDEASAVRLPVTAYIGQQEWERFRVDIVGSDLRMLGEPDDVPPIAKVDLPELQQRVTGPIPSLITSRTRSPRRSSCTGSHKCRRLDTATSSIWSRSRAERRSTRSGNSDPCGLRQNGAASRCRRGSTSQIEDCGRLVMCVRPQNPFWRMRTRSMRLSRSCGPSSIRFCWARPVAAGITNAGTGPGRDSEPTERSPC